MATNAYLELPKEQVGCHQNFIKMFLIYFDNQSKFSELMGFEFCTPSFFGSKNCHG